METVAAVYDRRKNAALTERRYGLLEKGARSLTTWPFFLPVAAVYDRRKNA